jgi:hypothetical protein
MGRLKKIKVSSTQSSSAVKTRIEDNNNASASDNISSTDADPQMQLTPTHSPIRDLVNQFCAEGLSSITTLERLVQMGYKVGEDAPTLSEIYIWRKEFRGDQVVKILLVFIAEKSK